MTLQASPLSGNAMSSTAGQAEFPTTHSMIALSLMSFATIAFQATWKSTASDIVQEVMKPVISFFLLLLWGGALLGFGVSCKDYSTYRGRVYLYGLLGANGGLGWAVFIHEPVGWYTYVLCAVWPANIVMLGAAAFEKAIKDKPVVDAQKEKEK